MIERFYTAGHKIERFQSTLGTYGEIVKNWQPHLAVIGKLWQRSGSEVFASDKDTPISNYTFATSLADISELDRYVDPDGTYYNIISIAKRVRPDGSGHLELALELVK